MISFGRIEKFLELQELIDSNIIKYDDETLEKGIAIKITDGNFTWNKHLLEKKDKIMEINEEEEKEKAKKNRYFSKRKRTCMDFNFPKIKNDCFAKDENEEEKKSKNEENEDEHSDSDSSDE